MRAGEGEGGDMHIPTVCLLSSSLRHPVSLRHEPLRCCSQHHRIAQKKNSPIKDIQSLFGAQMSLYMYDTLASHVHTEVFHQSPAVRETRCVTFLVNRHERGGKREGANSLFRCSFKKRYGFNNAEWQNHCCFCAVVVVSSAHEDQVKKCRDKRVNQRRNRQ